MDAYAFGRHLSITQYSSYTFISTFALAMQRSINEATVVVLKASNAAACWAHRYCKGVRENIQKN